MAGTRSGSRRGRATSTWRTRGSRTRVGKASTTRPSRCGKESGRRSTSALRWCRDGEQPSTRPYGRRNAPEPDPAANEGSGADAASRPTAIRLANRLSGAGSGPYRLALDRDNLMDLAGPDANYAVVALD